ncbi:MAG: type II toxin-antitoxin system HicA family toxin [Verrucomicrobia bacterium]|jgi:predicted RNA binding protein YcfA (HicA-like mRNA interferase family)|nr:type II toxin-antitoxin system HicA family toxin [Verrucomicrobiota bacterium]
MPKLPVVSGKECRKALTRLGFIEARQRGSHVVMRRGEAGCVVPMHAEIKTGTLAGILRQAGVAADEFVAVLGS